MPPRNVLDVSYVTSINHQCSCFVTCAVFCELEGDSCCSAQCTGHFVCVRRIHHESHLSWQVQHLASRPKPAKWPSALPQIFHGQRNLLGAKEGSQEAVCWQFLFMRIFGYLDQN